jgi:peptidoglycan hydrolase-like protein with peptidoglycan-binding domain
VDAPAFDPGTVGFPPPPPIFGDPGSAVGAPPPVADAPAPMAAPAGIGGASSEEQIRWIQFVLNAVLGTSLPTDGVPSADLRSALQTFQGQHGLPVSGFAGPDTIAALQAAAAGQGTSAGQAAAPGPQSDASAAPAAPEGDAQGGEFEILPAFGGRGSLRMHQRGRS